MSQRRAVIVLGLGFGDEGKGATTDWLTGQMSNPLVIRFNGGHQAGHTVMRKDGRRHVFSSFGAGTFHAAPTYWSNFCTFSPQACLNEYAALKNLGLDPVLYVDNLCPVTTQYDLLFNQIEEKSRGDNRHGSVGVGFGSTVQRHSLQYKLFVQDLDFLPIVKEKLKGIRQYYLSLSETIPNCDFANFDHDLVDIKFINTIEKIKQLPGNPVQFVNGKSFFRKNFWENYIFEGAQGILLDMDFGVFPNVTRSNTTSKNGLILIDYFDLKVDQTEVFYISRCYQTRHGAGYMTNEDILLDLIHTENETNVAHEFQGSFRRAPLDLDLIDYALQCDENFSAGLTKRLVVTCLDQVRNGRLTYSRKGIVEENVYKELFSGYKSKIENMYYGFGPYGEFST